mmetsp:Transcript_1627/g.4441  ORF Transcript_1627/g.4441 Transcript_1627/m.4441 type:complete len:235 (+) Transcript_1627:966-1670(+)
MRRCRAETSAGDAEAPAGSAQQHPMPSVAPAALPVGDNIWRGSWSDGLFSCFSDWPSCLLGILGIFYFLPILGYLKAWPLGQVKILSFRVAVLMFGGLSLAYTAINIWSTTQHPNSSFYSHMGQDGLWHFGYHAEQNPVWLLPLLAIIIVLFVLSLVYRTKLRRHYDIEAGDSCGDCCLLLWCWPCAILQEYRHVLRACGFKKDIFPRVMAPVQYHNGMAYVWARPQQQTETQV